MDKLTQMTTYVRRLRQSLGPDSYSRYKRGREHERKRADDERERAMGSAEHVRGEAERQREYDERYADERAHTLARERPDETGPEPKTHDP